MAQTKRKRYVNLPLSEYEKARLQAYADYYGMSLNEVLRDCIKSLPEHPSN